MKGELGTINSKVNQYAYIGEEVDTWKTPEDFYADGGGDCEDFAIAKYVLVDSKYTREIMVVWDVPREKYHAVLLVQGYWILDNIKKDVYKITDAYFNRNNIVIYRTKQITKPDEVTCCNWY